MMIDGEKWLFRSEASRMAGASKGVFGGDWLKRHPDVRTRTIDWTYNDRPTKAVLLNAADVGCWIEYKRQARDKRIKENFAAYYRSAQKRLVNAGAGIDLVNDVLKQDSK